MKSQCIVIETPHCFVAYMVNNIYLCASGITLDDAIDNLEKLTEIWDETEAEDELKEILNINKIHGKNYLN